jgi:hypothetical protein
MNSLLNLHFDVRGDLLDAARACEEEVFLQAFGNTRDQLEDEYGPYNDQSVFVAVADDSGEVYGSARLITPGPAGIKTINDLSREPWQVDGLRSARAAQIDLDSTWDLATCGVRREYRRQGLMVAMAMYHAFMKSTRVNEVQTATSMLDEYAYRVLTANGFRFNTLPGARPAPYLGSPKSTPVYGHWADIADAQRRLNPEAYRMITMGIGFDGVALPAESDWVLRPQLAPVAATERRDVAVVAA